MAIVDDETNIIKAHVSPDRLAMEYAQELVPVIDQCDPVTARVLDLLWFSTETNELEVDDVWVGPFAQLADQTLYVHESARKIHNRSCICVWGVP